jgi:MFS family permease
MTLAFAHARRSVVVSTLGITQTLAWGSTYYLPAVLADPIAEGLHLPREWFFGVFSASLLLSGLLGPLAGRMIDRHGGRDVLVGTNFAFAIGLVALAFSFDTMGLIIAWTVLGIGMGFGLLVWSGCTQLDYRYHAVCRLCQHGRMADQCDLH